MASPGSAGLSGAAALGGEGRGGAGRGEEGEAEALAPTPPGAVTSRAAGLSRGLVAGRLPRNGNLHVLGLPNLSRNEKTPWAGEMTVSAGSGPSRPFAPGDPHGRGEGTAPFTSDLNVFWGKGCLGPASCAKGERAQLRDEFTVRPVPPCVSLSPLPAGPRRLLVPLPPSLEASFPPQQLGPPVLCVWHWVPRHAASTLRLTTYGFSLAESGLSVAEGQGPASTSMLKCPCELHTRPTSRRATPGA